MVLPISLQVQQIRSIGHVKTKSVDPKNPAVRQRQHVYTGWIEVNAVAHAGDAATERFQLVSFVPISPGVIETVSLASGENPLRGTTVTVRPASVALDESNTIFAVDGASVALERQTALPGVAGDHLFCLVLRMNVAIQQGELLRVTYQVTALWNDVEQITETPALPGSQAPIQKSLESLAAAAQALHVLTQRLIADGDIAQARVAALEAIQAYRQIAATSGADVDVVANNALNLSSMLAAAGLAGESTAVAQAAVDVLKEFDPPTQALLTHRTVLAQALHVLTQRLIADGDIAQARVAALEAIQAYRQIAATSGADVDVVANNALNLSSMLATAGLAGEAALAREAAAAIASE
ncbi:hypothetical protein ACFCYC_15230 [Streptomyces sp. NPDC056402]|uniref:hypothetical protein n=1 Tax=Streptomyces sp. NPDC056402 TaxID=3345810 RepID=UPI0035D72E0B